jgi:hypothetical protein
MRSCLLTLRLGQDRAKLSGPVIKWVRPKANITRILVYSSFADATSRLTPGPMVEEMLIFFM